MVIVEYFKIRENSSKLVLVDEALVECCKPYKALIFLILSFQLQRVSLYQKIIKVATYWI
jgi:hypothetical protein